MKKWMVMFSVALAICVFQFAGSSVSATEDTESVIAAAENPADQAAPAPAEEGAAVEEGTTGEEVQEGDQPAVEQEEAPAAGEEGTTEEKPKSE